MDIHQNKIINFIKKFQLSLTHIHGQNLDNMSYLDKNGDPIQLEMTFSNSKKILSNQYEIPHRLDQPSDARYDDVQLKFEN